MKADLQELNRQWVADPCWDIESTEGFDAHYDELLAFRKETEARWARERQERNERRAADLGCPAFPEIGDMYDRAEQASVRHHEHLACAETVDPSVLNHALQSARYMGFQDAVKVLAPALQSLHDRLTSLEQD